MRIKAIRTEADHKAALEHIDALMGASAGSPAGDELDVLVDLVEHYEEKHVPDGFPSPVAAIEFRMEQAGLAHATSFRTSAPAPKFRSALRKAAANDAHGAGAPRAPWDSRRGAASNRRTSPMRTVEKGRLEQVSGPGDGEGRLAAKGGANRRARRQVLDRADPARGFAHLQPAELYQEERSRAQQCEERPVGARSLVWQVLAKWPREPAAGRLCARDRNA